MRVSLSLKKYGSNESRGHLPHKQKKMHVNGCHICIIHASFVYLLNPLTIDT